MDPSKITKSSMALDIIVPIVSWTGVYLLWRLSKFLIIKFTSGEVIVSIIAALLSIGLLSMIMIILHLKLGGYYHKQLNFEYRNFFKHALLISYLYTVLVTFTVTSEHVDNLIINFVKSIFFPFSYWYFLIFMPISIGFLYYGFYLSKKPEQK